MTRGAKLWFAWCAVGIPCNVISVATADSVWFAAFSGLCFALNVYVVVDLLGYSPAALAKKRTEDWRRMSDQWQALADTWRKNYFDLIGTALEQRRRSIVSAVVDVTDPANPKPLKVRPN